MDDGLVMCRKSEIIDKILIDCNKQFEIVIMNSNCFVELEFKHNLQEKQLFVSQYNYITRMLKRFNMQDCNSMSTPADLNLSLSVKDSPVHESEKQEMRKISYREAVGSLMFIAIVSRPDIMYSVNQVSRFLNNPGQTHWIAIKRIFWYLQGTATIGIMYTGSNNTLKIFSDADFANDIDNRKSISGYISTLANAPITWLSKQQKCVARSTTESKYIFQPQKQPEKHYGYVNFYKNY